MAFLLWLLDYSARHIFNRGYLDPRADHPLRPLGTARRQAAHVFFASNYDGSLESYMDDFINKVAWGINVVFGNGVGFPRVSWLFSGGAKFEQKYKRYLRRHQVPTAVWYKAYPGLAAGRPEPQHADPRGPGAAAMRRGERGAWLRLL